MHKLVRHYFPAQNARPRSPPRRMVEMTDKGDFLQKRLRFTPSISSLKLTPNFRHTTESGQRHFLHSVVEPAAKHRVLNVANGTHITSYNRAEQDVPLNFLHSNLCHPRSMSRAVMFGVSFAISHVLQSLGGVVEHNSSRDNLRTASHTAEHRCAQRQ